MPKGSNCALVHEYKPNYIVSVLSGVYLKQNYCYKCANDMLVMHETGDIREWQ